MSTPLPAVSANERKKPQKPIKRRSKGNGKRGSKGALFQAVPLDKTQAKPDYMPYGTIHFPSLRSNNLKDTGQLDSLWMVGALDHEKDTSITPSIAEYKVFFMFSLPALSHVCFQMRFKQTKAKFEGCV